MFITYPFNGFEHLELSNCKPSDAVKNRSANSEVDLVGEIGDLLASARQRNAVLKHTIQTLSELKESAHCGYKLACMPDNTYATMVPSDDKSTRATLYRIHPTQTHCFIPQRYSKFHVASDVQKLSSPSTSSATRRNVPQLMGKAPVNDDEHATRKTYSKNKHKLQVPRSQAQLRETCKKLLRHVSKLEQYAETLDQKSRSIMKKKY